MALAGLVTTVGSALALMSGAVFFLYLTGSTYWAILQDTVRGENIGGVGGFIHMMANCAGIIGPAVTGYIVQYTGAFTSAFVLAGAIAIGGVPVRAGVRQADRNRRASHIGFRGALMATPRLCAQALAELPASVSAPCVRPAKGLLRHRASRARGFHRAHQAVYTDDRLAAGDS